MVVDVLDDIGGGLAKPFRYHLDKGETLGLKEDEERDSTIASAKKERIIMQKKRNNYYNIFI